MVNFAALTLTLLATASLTGAVPSPLEARADCRDDNTGHWKRGKVDEAKRCIDELAALNSQCVTDASGRLFRKCGSTIITGLSVAPAWQFPTISSPCKDVARGAGKIMDGCSRGDGTVMGQNPAWGNGNLIVSILGA